MSRGLTVAAVPPKSSLPRKPRTKPSRYCSQGRSRVPGSHLPRRGSRDASGGLLTAWLPVGSLSDVSEQTSIPADPELDPTATYATDSAVVRRLARLLCATGQTTTTYAPA